MRFGFSTIIAGTGLQPDEMLGVDRHLGGRTYYDVDHAGHAVYGISAPQGEIVVLRPDGIFAVTVGFDQGGGRLESFSMGLFRHGFRNREDGINITTEQTEEFYETVSVVSPCTRPQERANGALSGTSMISTQPYQRPLPSFWPSRVRSNSAKSSAINSNCSGHSSHCLDISSSQAITTTPSSSIIHPPYFFKRGACGRSKTAARKLVHSETTLAVSGSVSV